ncbi:MAG TPA: glycosyltransferase family 4 protein [Clostridiales bacterium]|nr:glycosyltransferase family 4 protein [Clostridiales bacterium]
MRIAMLTNNYKPFVGGVPISIERLSEGLRELGHEVYIFAPSYEWQVEEPYVIRYRSYKRKLRGEMVVPNVLDQSIEFGFIQMTFDIIHVHHPMLMGYIAHYLGWKYNIPIVFTYHTRYEQYLHYLPPYDHLQRYCDGNSNSKIRRFEKKVFYYGSEKLVTVHNRVFTNKCDLVLAPTNSMKEYLLDNGTMTNVEIIPTGLLEEDFAYDPDKSKGIRDRCIGEKKYLFCTVSRLEKEKNISFILKGLTKLKEKQGDCFRLLVIGDGSERAQLELEARKLAIGDNIIFTGSIDHDELANYYSACDGFLFASRSETQGIVLLEAMAVGLPVVAVEASGVNDVVKDGFNGFLSELDIDQWEAKLSLLLEKEGSREWMARNAIEEAKSYLSSNVSRKVEQLYYDQIASERVVEYL